MDYLPAYYQAQSLLLFYLSKTSFAFFKHFIYLFLSFLNTVKNLFHLSRVGETLQQTRRHSALLNSVH